MSERPTREQAEAARRRVDRIEDATLSGHAIQLDAEDVAALRTLLAAFEPATDEELAKEASAYARLAYPESPFIASMAYIAGARREGRR